MDVGFVKSVKNFLIYLDGLPGARINQIIESKRGVRALVSNINRDLVEALLLGDADVKPGEMFGLLKTSLTVGVGKDVLGRVINPLGKSLDGRQKPKFSDRLLIFKKAPPLSDRRFISEQFVTGITLIDTIIPLGKGQRELILGDAHSGKTDFLIEVIKNQKKTGVISIYGAVGRPVSEIRHVFDTLKKAGALSQTVIVASSSNDSPPVVFLTPHTALTIAEYFQEQGQDVLVILDDLGNHAKIYREISLLGNKRPGREAYPGDIFYQHARILERAGCFSKEAGGGSITALPVIEIGFVDFTTYIPTNLMATTDGHLLFKASLFAQGRRPAIDIFRSVSRVGSQTQERDQNVLAQKIKSILAMASQYETVGRFATDLPAQTQTILKQKEKITKIINQEEGFVSIREQVRRLSKIINQRAKHI
ncbi:MAG: F0F1 ATP synthase subunit alpha [Candidatus Blackburnbacteria bacterium]|nr:F0F1 ATP synthase subunit alpha [Candidatus Blackburnbacteria bacterium]